MITKTKLPMQCVDRTVGGSKTRIPKIPNNVFYNQLVRVMTRIPAEDETPVLRSRLVQLMNVKAARVTQLIGYLAELQLVDIFVKGNDPKNVSVRFTTKGTDLAPINVPQRLFFAKD